MITLFFPTGYLKNGFTSAYNKNVVVIGGGDTGVDCVATCVRQVRADLKRFWIVYVYR